MTRRIIIYIAAAVLLTAAIFTPAARRLCVTAYADSKLLAVFEAGDFIISYTHSVNLGRVHDYYTVTEDMLYLRRTVFVSYGAGMPEPVAGQAFKVTDDGLEISGIDLELKGLILQTGIIAGHALETGGSTVILNELVPPQTRIVIDIKRISVLDILRLRLKP